MAETIEQLFTGESEMHARCRELDWAATPLGPPEDWAPALRDAARMILDAAFPIALWCGPHLIGLYNDGYIRVLGPRHPQALGRGYADIWSDIWAGVAQQFERIAAGGPPVYGEDAPFVLHGPAGTAAAPGEPNAWFTYSLSAVRDETGDVVAFLNIASESTARILAEREREAARERLERAEARLREMFAQAPAFMAVLRGPEHVFEYVNDAYYSLVGRRELIGRPVLEALPEVRGQGFEHVLARVLETGEPFVGRELRVEVARSPGEEPEERYVDFIYYPITEPDGTRSGVVAHGSDVTGHVLARREALEARAEAERANQAKSQFLANMSHEIRTPINAIMGYADLADAGVAGELTPVQREYLDRVRASTRHLLALVNDILDLSKIEAGEMRVETGEALLDAITDAAVEMVAPQASRKRVRVSQAHECADLRFIGDADRTRQIVLNLLSNAVKFTPPGGSVTLRCRMADEAPGLGTRAWAALDVEDTGRGIAPEDLERIFEPFVQSTGQGVEPAGGTGLGLTISRQFARLMGGDLTVRSRPGEGSCFTLWLRRG